MKRIIMHWTAGGNRANGTDRRHYHRIIEVGPDGRPRAVAGNHAIEDNESTSDGSYAAHTRALNTGSIGVAVAGMRGARERPFDAGPSPMTPAQIDALCAEVARLAKRYRIPITRETVLTHAEVQPTLGVWQRNKWDIVWLPGMSGPGDPIAVGDELRKRIRAKTQSRPAAAAKAVKDEATTPAGIIAGILAAIAALWALTR